MTKIAGSGSISQRHGYPDPDPHQNVMDPEHWFPESTPIICSLDYSQQKRPTQLPLPLTYFCFKSNINAPQFQLDVAKIEKLP
jgi:hypothetical protein